MRHGESQEGDRAAVCSHYGNQHAGADYDPETGAPDIQAKIAGISVAQQKQIERLYQQHRKRQQHRHYYGESGHLAARDAGETAEAPHHIGADILLGAEELQHADDRRRHVAYHHADNQQGDVAADLLRHIDYKCHNRQRSDNRRHRHRELSHIAQTAQRHSSETAGEQYHESDAEAGTGADSQHRRAGQWVAEEGLHQKA